MAELSVFWNLVTLVVPAVVILTTLFGLLARGDPKPGGVALFLRVGVVGFLIGAIVWYLIERTALWTGRPDAVVNGYRGLVGGSILLLLLGVFGAVLKKKH
jgi:hypothetical protein